MKAVITGGTGLLGSALLQRLPDAVVLTRDAERTRLERRPGTVASVVRWSPEAEPAPREALEGTDAIFHLAGEPVANGRWTSEKMRRIRDSRVIGTRNLLAGLRSLERKPRVVVSASAVGYYGDRGDEVLDETSPPGSGFLADVCREWEQEAHAAETLGCRVVCVRIGIVLDAHGGALPRMVTPFRFGAGGRLGSGRQWMPWVHIEDVVGLLLYAAHTAGLHGALNAVAPAPVTNAEFTRALGHVLHRPAFMRVPRAALRLAFGAKSEIVMASQRVLPRAAQRSGYSFRHVALEGALRAALAPSVRQAA